MKKRIFFFLLLFFGAGFISKISAQNPFITTWQTTDGGITIPIISEDSLTYNYDIEWNNLTNPGAGNGSDTEISTDYTIDDLNNGDTYEIKISGTFPAIYFLGSGAANAAKIQTIEQWGDIEWQTMYFAFWQCENLTSSATDAPDLSQVTSLLATFGLATSFNSDLNNWQVSSIKDMTGTFFGATSFNGNISNWSTFDVENMSQMFDGATSFNQDIGNWSVSSVTTMNGMFRNASSFNQSLTDWFTFNVTNMSNMFSGASSFDQPLGDWNIGDVTTMAGMLDNSGLSKLNYDATLRGWESFFATPTNVTLGANGLIYCNALDSRTTLTGTALNWTINNDILQCEPFVTTWQVSDNEITIPTYTFGSLIYFYEVSWSNLTNPGEGDGSDAAITGTYTIAELNNGDIYEVSISGDFPRIYFQNFNLSAEDRAEILTIEQWGDQEWSSMDGAFSNCVNLVLEATDTPLLRNATSFRNMFSGATNFEGDLSDWDVSTIEDMERMFENATSFNSNLNNWDVSNVNIMSSMFREATNFNSDLSNWDVSNVTQMASIFSGATSFNRNLNSWDVSNVNSMSNMFAGATSFNNDISNWSVNNATSMDGMFREASAFNGDISDWNVGNVTRMNEMFADATSFRGDLSNWDVRNVTEMAGMFNGATSFNSDLSDWNVAKVTNMGGMFWNATSFNQNLENWDISSVLPFEEESSGPVGMESFFTNSDLSTFNYDSTLIGWATLSAGESQIPTDIILGAQNLNYCVSDDERSSLIEDFGWTFEDDGPGCSAPSIQASGITFSNVTDSQMDIAWVNGDGSRRLVIARENNSVDSNPNNRSVYTANSVFGAGQELGTGNFVVYNGNGNNFTLSELSEGTTYHIRIYEYNGDGGLEVYNRTTVSGNPSSQETLSIPNITDFNPPIAGEGMNITINGSGFNGVNFVSFGGTSADSFTVESDSIINATVAKGSTGDVLVRNLADSATRAGFEFIPAPIITSFSPVSASPGETINITGANLSTTSEVSFGGINADSFTAVSDTLINAVVGEGSNGQVFLRTIGGSASLGGFNLSFSQISVFSANNSAIANNQPEPIDLGTSVPGEVIEAQLIILNSGNSDLIISDFLSSSEDFVITAAPDTISPGSPAQFTVQFSSNALGDYDSEITIRNNSFNSPNFTFNVSAEIIGLNIINNDTDSIIISNEDINLGSTVINVNVDKIFSIENLSSKSSIEIENIVSDNPIFQVINAPSTIAPLSTEEFTVRLNANTVGEYSGIVTVTTSLNEFSFAVFGTVLAEASTEINVYNVVTPNGDGRHDYLQIENITEYTNNSVSIYNRLGNKVFDINNYNNSSNVFEGLSNNGEELLTGNYYYVIDKGNGDKRITGFLLIKR
ncbi:gliding motility-associated C-terminal domain-containing protein [Marivirga sericea]|uniref:Gliding motility-associated C-terminal domain-containing protein n=1 Tax=Marivirga sericea TaxID=1028 RepID=A0A1X7LG68_9BACT|nr:BspA family leucine-rich repeat surface protein [Marivirga sericea]SMG52841.1 gliding motility-associated C-terminal domain-containing protein [Marivirga sericea]